MNSASTAEYSPNRKEQAMKKFIDFIVFVFTGKGDFAKEAIEAGVISYEGQGRDKYGK